MYDKELVLQILKQIKNSIELIEKRISPVKTSEDFVDSEEGLEKLDAICMQLLAIGEGLKQLDKITNKRLLSKYPQIEWDKAMKMRDVIAHHYFDVDEEIVFIVCKKELPKIKDILIKIIKDIAK